MRTAGRFVVADPAKGTRGAMFDAGKLAAALHDASGGAIKDDAQPSDALRPCAF